MARDNQPVANSVEAELRRQLDDLKNRIAKLNQTTTTTFQQIRPADVLDPIEGQVIINWADQHRLYWYSNGEWHSNCDCPEAGIGEILVTGRLVGGVYPSIFTLDPVGGTFVTVAAEVSGEYWTYAFWSPDRSRIFCEKTFDANSTRQMWSMNPDGTDQILLWSNTTFANGLYTHSKAGGNLRYVALNQNVPRTIIMGDEVGASSTIWNPAVNASGFYDRPRVAAFSPDGLRLSLVVRTSVNAHRHFIYTIASGTMFWTGLADADFLVSKAPSYNPLDNGQLMYLNKAGANDKINLINEDGTGQTIIYTSPGSGEFDIFADSFRWSPDGTMISFQEWEFGSPDILRLKIIDTSGTVLGSLGLDNQFTERLAWSPDSSQIAISYSDGKVDIVDVPSMTVSTKSGAPFDNGEYIEWSNPTWFE